MSETHHLIKRARETAEESQRVRAEARRLVQTSRELQHWTARVQGRAVGAANSTFSFNRFSNCLLGLLPSSEFARLAPMLQGIAFTAKQVLHRASQAVENVYFPVGGLLSARISMQDGKTI